MKSLIVIVLLVIVAVICINADPASYSQPLPVSTRTTTYDFPSGSLFGGSGSQLVVSASNASPGSSFVTVTKLNTAPNAFVNSNSYALPTGFGLISGGDVGYVLNFTSDLSQASGLSATFTVAAKSVYSGLSSQGNRLSLLAYNAATQSYSAVSSSQYSVASNGAITIQVTGSSQFIISAQSTRAVAVNVTSSASSSVYVLANSSQAFAVYNAGNLALVINGLVNQAGDLTVSVISSASASAAASASGLALVSSVYSITTSSGSASGNLTFNLQNSASTNFSASSAQWYRLEANGAVALGGSLSGSVLTQNVASISGNYCVLASFSSSVLSSYNANLGVSASASVYAFGKANGLGPLLTVISDSASVSSSVSVGVIAQLPLLQLPLFSTSSLPCGFSSLSSFTGQQGFNISFSADLAASGSVSGSKLVTPVVAQYKGLVAAGWSIVPLSFNASANAYVALPSNQYQVAANGSVSISLTGSIALILAIYNPTFCNTCLPSSTSTSSCLNIPSLNLLLAGNFATSSVIGAVGAVSLGVQSNVSAQVGAAAAVSIQVPCLSAGIQAALSAQVGGQSLSNVFSLTASAGFNASAGANAGANVGGNAGFNASAGVNAGVSASVAAQLSFYLPGVGCPAKPASRCDAPPSSSSSDESTEGPVYEPGYDAENPGNRPNKRRQSLSGSASASVNTSISAAQRASAQLYNYNSISGQWQLVLGSFFTQGNCVLNVPITSSLFPYFTLQATASVSASYSQSLGVTARPIIYTFGSVNGSASAAASLTVSASAAASAGSSVTVTPVALPNITVAAQAQAQAASPVVFNLPSGYSPISSAAFSQGYNFTFSSDLAAASSLSAIFQVPVASLSTNYGSNLAFLYYNASSQAFTQVSPSNYNISTDGSVSVAVAGSGAIYLATKSAANTAADLSNNLTAYFLVAANASQSFVIQQNGRAVVAINNLAAAAGTFAVSVSANAQAQYAAAAAAGNVVVSSIYTFNHSLGSSAVSSAQLSYNLSAAASAGVDVNTLSWYRFNTATNTWDQKSSSLSGSGSSQVLVTSTNSFSDWSVQQSQNSGASTAPNAGGSASGLRVNGALLSILELLM